MGVISKPFEIKNYRDDITQVNCDSCKKDITNEEFMTLLYMKGKINTALLGFKYIENKDFGENSIQLCKKCFKRLSILLGDFDLKEDKEK